MTTRFLCGIAYGAILLGLLGTSRAHATEENSVTKPKELMAAMLAPDFSAHDEAGNLHSLKDYRGKKNVVLAFYPMDMTGG